MARFGGLLDAKARGRARGMALVAILAGSLLLTPAPTDAAPRERKSAQPAAPAAAASAASPAVPTPPHLSPYLVARRRAQAASGLGHAPSVPPTARRTRQAIGQQARP